jgi:hypothetical protein
VSELPAPRIPSLALRAAELRALAWPGASLSQNAGRELRFRFQICPGPFGRLYDCALQIKRDSLMPVLRVLKPNLFALAGGRRPPHIYSDSGPGTSLCLWWPKRREWQPNMKLADTYLAWTAEWLWYFEDWLATGAWAGGGEHPPSRPARRWSPCRES